MKFSNFILRFGFVIILGLCALQVRAFTPAKKLVCFYDSSSYLRNGEAKFSKANLEPALRLCTHLIYGYAGIKPRTYELKSLNINLDSFHYREITALKRRYPGIKIYLSVGGDKDVDSSKYVELLEARREKQQDFIDSSIALLRDNGFDGLDLAFQLPRNKPRKVHSGVQSIWKSIKKRFTGDFIVDPKAQEHKRQFTELVKNLKREFKYRNLELSMTVLPNVNSTWYFDPTALEPHLEFVNLAAFDFVTPQRNPEEADYTSPIYQLPQANNRVLYHNIEHQINYWLDRSWPARKLNLGIASYGRAWKMTKKSGLTGVPVVENTKGEAEAGSQTRTPGLLSWPEICSQLPNTTSTSQSRGRSSQLRKVNDPRRRYGNYAFHPTENNNANGIWVSYDDPDFAGVKAMYARNRGLGGVALFDITNDDFAGRCTGQMFPILRTIDMHLY